MANKTVTVAKGNTLSGIAAANNVSVAAIAAANPQITNLNVIKPGQQITIPTVAATKTSTNTYAGGVTGGANPFAANSGVNTNTLAGINAASGFTTPMTISGVVTTNPVTTTVTTDTTTTTTTTDTSTSTTDYIISTTTDAAGNVYGIWKSGKQTLLSAAPKAGTDQATLDLINSLKTQISNMANAQAAAAAQAAADKLANKQKAADTMIATFAANGISDKAFSDYINSQIMADVPQEQVLLGLYDQQAYKDRFPGMASLRAKNRTITEAQYIGLENQMVQTLKFFDLPTGFYDNRQMLGKIIGNEVSAKEVQDRAQAAQDLAKATNPEIRTALKDYYNIGEGDITAYLLNADIAGPIVLKRARAAEIAGLAKTAGFDAFDSGTAETLAGKGQYSTLSLSDLATGIGKAGTLAANQRRLSYIENQNYSDQEALAATMEADQQALLASQKRAAREVARFGGQSGLSAYSLRTGSEGSI